MFIGIGFHMGGVRDKYATANHAMRDSLKHDFIKNILKHSCIFEPGPVIPAYCRMIRYSVGKAKTKKAMIRDIGLNFAFQLAL
ncbi:hypothetical protein D3C78_1678920 [compost metagenome]